MQKMNLFGKSTETDKKPIIKDSGTKGLTLAERIKFAESFKPVTVDERIKFAESFKPGTVDERIKFAESFKPGTADERIKFAESFKPEAAECTTNINDLEKSEPEVAECTTNINDLEKSEPSFPYSNGIITFSLDDNIYTLNPNNEEERQQVLSKVNAHSQYTWDWFQESFGKFHWVLYNTEMYEVWDEVLYKYLHYREDSSLVPTIPINASSCCSMFLNYKSSKILDLSRLDTAGIVDMSYMFKGSNFGIIVCQGALSHDKIQNNTFIFTNKETSRRLEISGLDTSNVVSASGMFAECEDLQVLDLSSLNTCKVEDFSYFLDGCCKLKTLVIDLLDTSSAKNMSHMFSECKALTTLDLSRFDFSNVEATDFMFSMCTALKEIYFSPGTTDKLKNTQFMFYHCESLEDLNLAFWTTPALILSDHMFEGCYKLKSLVLINLKAVELVEISHMFEKCSSLVSLSIPNLYTNTVYDKEDILEGCNSLMVLYTSDNYIKAYAKETFPSVKIVDNTLNESQRTSTESNTSKEQPISAKQDEDNDSLTGPSGLFGKGPDIEDLFSRIMNKFK